MWPDAEQAAAAAGLLRRTVVMWAISGEVGSVLERRRGMSEPLD